MAVQLNIKDRFTNIDNLHLTGIDFSQISKGVYKGSIGNTKITYFAITGEWKYGKSKRTYTSFGDFVKFVKDKKEQYDNLPRRVMKIANKDTLGYSVIHSHKALEKYRNFIELSQDRQIDTSKVIETHHIVPRSMGVVMSSLIW